MSTTERLTVNLDADEANAVVDAIAWAVTNEGAGLENLPLDSPGELFRIELLCDRIARLNEVNRQLKWRKHWGPTGGEPPAVTATKAVLLEIASELHERAEYEAEFEYERAARTLACAYADAELAGAGAQR